MHPGFGISWPAESMITGTVQSTLAGGADVRFEGVVVVAGCFAEIDFDALAAPLALGAAAAEAFSATVTSGVGALVAVGAGGMAACATIAALALARPELVTLFLEVVLSVLTKRTPPKRSDALMTTAM